MLKCNNGFCRCGSITIYLALTISIMLSLIFSIIESARITSLKVRARAITFSALDSSFSHFALQLYDKYGVFGVFTTEDEFLSTIEKYAVKNENASSLLSFGSLNLINVSLDAIEYSKLYHMTDNDGLIFAKQAVQYEKYRAAADFISGISDLDNKLKENSNISPGEIADSSILISGDSLSALPDKPSPYSSELYTNLSSNEASALKESIVSKIVSTLKSNLLLLFVDEPSSISHISLSGEYLDVLPSRTCTLSQHAKNIQSGTASDTMTKAIDKALFLSYINNSFSSFFSNINPHISLRYQKEYILCGNTTDDDNLLSAALSLVNLRATFNLAYLLSNAQKRSAALNLSASICASVPLVSQIAAFVILSAWAYGEAIIDVKDLFSGLRVPLLKTDELWTLSLEGILTIDKNTISNNDGKKGYSYDEYLNMCFLASDSFAVYYRTMDLIQLDMCENHNKNFLMGACITGADVNATYNSSPLFTNIIQLALPGSYKFSTSIAYGYD